MAFREITQCDHCGQEIDKSKSYVEVALRHNRPPTYSEMTDMATIPHGLSEEDAIRVRDDSIAAGTMSMVRDEVLLHFCNDSHFAQYQTLSNQA